MKGLIFTSAICFLILNCVIAQITSAPIQVTYNSARKAFPAWSPDGNSIVYQYSDRNDSLGYNGLWRLSNDNKGPKQIFKGIAEHPKWSPDGRFIVFDTDYGNSTKMIPADGGDIISFLPDSITIFSGGLPCWSPDASSIAFKDSLYSLCVYNLQTGKLDRIFKQEGKRLLPGCWSEDGKYIWFTLMDPQTRKSTLWKISADGKKLKQINGHHENIYRYLAISPDGSMLVYTAMEGKYLGLFVMPSEGGNSIPLLINPQGHNEAPVWSPDGSQIAYCSWCGGNVEIWVIDVQIELLKKELKAEKQ